MLGLHIPGAIPNAPKASTEPLPKGMMLEIADGHTRPQSATCPIWMAFERLYRTLVEINSFFVSFGRAVPSYTEAAAEQALGGHLFELNSFTINGVGVSARTAETAASARLSESKNV